MIPKLRGLLSLGFEKLRSTRGKRLLSMRLYFQKSDFCCTLDFPSPIYFSRMLYFQTKSSSIESHPVFLPERRHCGHISSDKLNSSSDKSLNSSDHLRNAAVSVKIRDLNHWHIHLGNSAWVAKSKHKTLYSHCGTNLRWGLTPVGAFFSWGISHFLMMSRAVSAFNSPFRRLSFPCFTGRCFFKHSPPSLHPPWEVVPSGLTRLYLLISS